jgi:hypothetical protein
VPQVDYSNLEDPKCAPHPSPSALSERCASRQAAVLGRAAQQRDVRARRVREKLAYIYSYGITMFKRGMLDGDSLKEIVLADIAGRVNMDGPEFDKWLEIPAAV